MPVAINLEKHWRALAANAHAHAAPLTDPELRATMLQIAEAYERLADRARARERRKRALARFTS